MSNSAQRITLVLEDSAVWREDDEDEEEGAKERWCVVAYLISDSGKRDRATLQRCPSRSAASTALKDLWDDLTG